MSLLAAWAPPNERSTLSAVAYGGTYVGTALTLIISGYLINADVMGGWPSVFYLSGHATIIWFLLWTLLAFSSPADHPRISREEKAYLEYTIGTQQVQRFYRLGFGLKITQHLCYCGCLQDVGPTPWRKVLTSMPVWANVIAQVAHCWVIYTLLTEMPTYMKTVLHFDIKKVYFKPIHGSFSFLRGN